MSDMIEPDPPKRRPSPLIWIGVVVAGLIAYILLGSDRAGRFESVQEIPQADHGGAIERSLLIPPGMRAREYIAALRDNGKPYAFDQIAEQASDYQLEGSLADAHLLYFFSAREGYLPAIMKMGEMADPAFFRAQDSLLDRADLIQAYKWYRKAATQGHDAANERVEALQRWAIAEAEAGDPNARQFLLNFE